MATYFRRAAFLIVSLAAAAPAGAKVFLTQDEANANFNPTSRQEQQVVQWLQDNGLTVTQTYPNHLLVDASRSQPNLVIADIHMPGMDGFALLESIKLWQRPSPVIFITAYATQQLFEKAQASRAAGHPPGDPFVHGQVPAIPVVLGWHVGQRPLAGQFERRHAGGLVLLEV